MLLLFQCELCQWIPSCRGGIAIREEMEALFPGNISSGPWMLCGTSMPFLSALSVSLHGAGSAEGSPADTILTVSFSPLHPSFLGIEYNAEMIPNAVF